MVTVGYMSWSAYLCAGLVAVCHYAAKHALTLTGGQGVRLSLFAGIIAGVAATLLQHVLMVVGSMPALEFGGLLGLVSNTVWSAIVGGSLGLAGGAIGSSIWKRGDKEKA